MIGAPTDHDAPTTQIGAPATNQCASCGSPLAADQHYCLNCGERRGKPRFAAAAPPPPAVEEHRRTVTTAARPNRATSGIAFLGTVLVLLIALGVGVLIGHNNNGSNKVAAAPAQIVTVNGGGTGTVNANTPTTNAAVAPKTPPKVKATAHQTKAQVKKIMKVISAPVTAKEAANASNAAKSVLGGSNIPTSTVTVGQSATGPGSQGGKFTGNFFGQ